MNASEHYLATTQAAAAEVLRSYSSSFRLATSVLPGDMAADIHNLYAMVRVADEIVDGAAPADVAQELLADYEQQVLQAPQQEFHTDPILHSYAHTARKCAFSSHQVKAFFQAMAMDLRPVHFDATQLATYTYGSAEVIGEMCVRIFLRGYPGSPDTQEAARRLGNAFQIINFLRDLGADEALGRYYFGKLDDVNKQKIVCEALANIESALQRTQELPRRCRFGVHIAGQLYRELARRMLPMEVTQLRQQRLRLSNPTKLRIAARTLHEETRICKK